MDDDILDKVWILLKDDEMVRSFIESETDGLRIKYFTYPETADMEGSWIVLESIINGLPSDFADDTWVAYDYLIHIEVWSRNRNDNITLSNRIRDLLWENIKFKQNDSTDEYDLGIYRDARRYEGKLYRHDLEDISERRCPFYYEEE